MENDGEPAVDLQHLPSHTEEDLFNVFHAFASSMLNSFPLGSSRLEVPSQNHTGS